MKCRELDGSSGFSSVHEPKKDGENIQMLTWIRSLSLIYVKSYHQATMGLWIVREKKKYDPVGVSRLIVRGSDWQITLKKEGGSIDKCGTQWQLSLHWRINNLCFDCSFTWIYLLLFNVLFVIRLFSQLKVIAVVFVHPHSSLLWC